jgi:hypothetical protein
MPRREVNIMTDEELYAVLCGDVDDAPVADLPMD